MLKKKTRNEFRICYFNYSVHFKHTIISKNNIYNFTVCNTGNKTFVQSFTNSALSIISSTTLLNKKKTSIQSTLT